MNTILVTSVQRYTLDDDCADVTLNSGKAEVVAFCFLCDLQVGDVVSNPLSAMDGEVRAAFLSDWPDDIKRELSSERLERINNCSYRGIGRVLDQAEGLVEVLGFIIDFGDVPCGGAVEFDIERLDVRFK
jgi:hypothetical protein